MEGIVKLKCLILSINLLFINNIYTQNLEFNRNLISNRIDSIYLNRGTIKNSEFLFFKKDSTTVYYIKKDRGLIIAKNLSTSRNVEIISSIFECIPKVQLKGKEQLIDFLTPIVYIDCDYAISYTKNGNSIYLEGFDPSSYIPNQSRQEKRNEMIKKLLKELESKGI